MGAINEEITLLLKKLKTERVLKEAGLHFYVGTLSGKQVVICKSGVGKVNAALASQILVDRFRVKALIFTGVAGTISPNVNIGDLVVATKTQQWDVNFTAIGFPPGVIPLLKTSVFNTNPRLMRAAVQAAKQVPGNVFTGKILTADQFVASRTLARRLRTEFGGLCVEAEGGAVGQVCFRNRIPYVVIRGISDRADRKASPDFEKFLNLAANRAQRVVLRMVRLL
jgi:adenosylhomocysteine nucleosidase